MSLKFKFQVQGEWHDVVGKFGQGEFFYVTKFIEGAKRILGTQGGAPHGIKLIKKISATSETDLLAQLKQSFPALADFQPA